MLRPNNGILILAAIAMTACAAKADGDANSTRLYGGLQRGLPDKPFSFAGIFRLDTSRNLTGGLNTHSTNVRDLLDLNLTIDMEKLIGLGGGKLFVEFQSHNGPNSSETLTGDAQGFDNQDGPRFNQIYQLWYQQQFFEDKFRAKVGKIDSNIDFYVLEHGSEFLISSMAYSTTIFPMVTYPNPSPGAELFFEPDGHFYAGIGAFYSNRDQTFLNISGHPEEIERPEDGSFIIGETGYRWNLEKDELAGHAAVGGWGHTGEIPKLTTGTTEGTAGFYTLIDQSIWHVEAKDGSDKDVGIFGQYALSEPAVSLIDEHIGGGIAATGLVRGRPKDVQGIGLNWVHLGDQPNLNHSYELNIETFYKVQVSRLLNLKPDLQYIRHPGGTAPDALVVTLRMEAAF